MRGSATSRSLLREEGFALPEMLVTIMVMTTVLFALYSIFDMSLRVFSFGNDKVEAVENARLGLEKMEREIRAAYPVDKLATPPENHLFFISGAPGTPALPPAEVGLASHQRSTITFGNDLPQGGTPPNRRIYDSITNVVDTGEEITYRLSSTCPGGACTLERITNGGTPQPVVDFVVPNGLRFGFLKASPATGTLVAATAGDGTDAKLVRVTLTISKDGRTQTLTTDVDLKNRET